MADTEGPAPVAHLVLKTFETGEVRAPQSRRDPHAKGATGLRIHEFPVSGLKPRGVRPGHGHGSRPAGRDVPAEKRKILPSGRGIGQIGQKETRPFPARVRPRHGAGPHPGGAATPNSRSPSQASRSLAAPRPKKFHGATRIASRVRRNRKTRPRGSPTGARCRPALRPRPHTVLGTPSSTATDAVRSTSKLSRPASSRANCFTNGSPSRPSTFQSR